MAGTPLTNPNWATETTDTIVRLVGQVRDNGTTKVVYAARGLVFGVIAMFLAFFALVLVLIGLMRGVHTVFDLFLSRPQAVYASYLFVGGIFCIAGWFCFSKRGTSTSTS